MMSDKPNKQFVRNIIRKIFLEDWVMKLVALVITFGLWLGVTVISKGKQTSDRFTVPLNFRLLDNAEVTNAPVQEVEIRVRGVDEKIEQIRRNDMIAYVDLTELAPGESVLTLTPESVSVPLPEGVKVVDLQPSRIAVTIEAIEEREISVKAVTDGTPETGFEVYGEPTTLPQKVKVRGPASLVGAIDQLLTDKIPLNGRREDFTARQIPVTVANNKITIYNTVVDVFVRVGEKRIERTISINVDGRNVNATLYGLKTALAKIKPADIRVVITKDENGIDVPKFDLPSEIEVRDPRIR
ncbi:MAG: hypothetical protein KA956_00700 [Pyrinomonadaceae bacterium]|nr:hypothetical protein [Acidobacteriota bacterium]MBK7932815.1 hypothetical protein [Acidobacteriota bacterium]MBP7374971.1 hypothetical protein [Pyrinomonadaceae bacterium]